MEEIHRAIHEALLEAGPKQIAFQMGTSHTNLLNRANPNDDTHRLNVEQFLQILVHTNDMRPLAALAAEFGYDLVKREEVEPIALQDARELLSKESAELTLAMHSAMADGHMSRTERATVAKEAEDVRASAAAVIAAVKSA